MKLFYFLANEGASMLGLGLGLADIPKLLILES